MSLLQSRKYQASQPDAVGFEEHINLIDEDPGFHWQQPGSQNNETNSTLVMALSKGWGKGLFLILYI